MQKRSSTDPNKMAAQIVAQATGAPVRDKNPAAVLLGRLGGLKGGKARAKKLTPKERTKIAKKGAKARWSKTVRS